MAASRTTTSRGKPASKAKPAKPAAKPAKPAAKPAPAASKAKPAAKPAPAASKAKPAATPAKPATRASKPISTPTTAPAPRPSAPTTPAAPSPARFSFTAVPIVRDAAGLTPLLRQQLTIDARVRTGRVTTPDRIPTAYFRPGVVRWRIAERGKPMFEVVHDTAFFPDSAEPVGLERIAGAWQATGRGSERGRALDLPRLAWELMRDWPGRRLELPPEPKAGTRWKPIAAEPEAPWPPDVQFV